MLKYIFMLSCLFTLSLHGTILSTKYQSKPLLSDSALYVDYTKNRTIHTIKEQSFKSITKERLNFGYAPDFNVWVKINLTNPYNKKVERVLEYTHPLTTSIELYDGKTDTLMHRGGTSSLSILKSINPAFPIVLLPNEHKTYYLKASSSVTTLIIGLKLWEINSFYHHEMKHQFILALFFGAMGIIILYNLFIYFFVKEKIYLYYLIAFLGIIFHHLFYKGIGKLYFFSPEETISIVQDTSLIVTILTFFLALFTKNILQLERYPKLTKFLSAYLIFFIGMALFSYMMDLHNLRNVFSAILLIILFLITLYAFIHHNSQAKFIILGWIAVMSSGLFIYLSSLGYYDIFQSFPYYVELSLLLETLLFSLALANRLKQLRLDKIVSQKNLISYQLKEEAKLNLLAEEKTKQLQIAMNEKDLLLHELNHRVKNSIQTIISFLRLQADTVNDNKIQQTLMEIKNRIMSISHLYDLLYTKDNISYINTYEYFSQLIENIENTFQPNEVNTILKTNIIIRSEIAVYCGFIINEAITNAFQHAFHTKKKGNIIIKLIQKEKYYHLTIQDNGKGFNALTTMHNNLGLTIMKSLATYQLHGTFNIQSDDGTHIHITWEDRHG